jgi:hypothetical protein
VARGPRWRARIARSLRSPCARAASCARARRAKRWARAIPGSRRSKPRNALVDREQRFLREGACVQGVPVRVVELCGREGDIVLMRAELLHAAAPHALPAPRMVLAPFVYAR